MCFVIVHFVLPALCYRIYNNVTTTPITQLVGTTASDSGRTIGVNMILLPTAHRTIHLRVHFYNYCKHSSSTVMRTSPIPSSPPPTHMAPPLASNELGINHHAMPLQPMSLPFNVAHNRSRGKNNNWWNKPKQTAEITQLAAAEWTTPP